MAARGLRSLPCPSVAVDKSLSLLILSFFICKIGTNECLPASLDGKGACEKVHNLAVTHGHFIATLLQIAQGCSLYLTGYT